MNDFIKYAVFGCKNMAIGWLFMVPASEFCCENTLSILVNYPVETQQGDISLVFLFSIVPPFIYQFKSFTQCPRFSVKILN
jgi:hypothetical protein